MPNCPSERCCRVGLGFSWSMVRAEVAATFTPYTSSCQRDLFNCASAELQPTVRPAGGGEVMYSAADKAARTAPESPPL